jgi:acyl-CoA thioesterase-1
MCLHHQAMRICFIGDSFVNGTGDDDCLGWVGRLCSEARQRGHNVTLYNLGIRRDTSTDIASRWEREASARLPPEHDCRLVFSFGVNDCVREASGQPRVAESASIANARLILMRAREWRPTIMIGPPCSGDAALDGRVRRLSDQLGVLCEELSIPFLSAFEAVYGSVIWQRDAERGDGIHPNRDGYSLLYEAVLAWNSWREWVP